MKRYVPAAGLVALAVILTACGSVAVPSVTRAPSPTATVVASASPSSSPAGSVAPPASASPATSWAPDAAALGRIGADLDALAAIAEANGGIRASGTDGYDASAEWAAGRLAELGYDVFTPDVPFIGFADRGVTLKVGGRSFSGPDEARALIYSAGGTVAGPVAVLEDSGCAAGDFADVQPGAVVLTVGGGCFRRDQALHAVDAGAVALVVGYPGRGPGEIFRPTLLSPAGIDIPVVSVTGEAVDALSAVAGQEAELSVDVAREPAVFRNVIGELGDGPRTVMVGAHLDSVLDGPGINDNGSGVAAVLELARAVALAGVPDGWSIRIGLWGGEEFGTYGSRAYADGLDPGLVAYLNLDMAGSVNGANLVYDEPGAAPGSPEITARYERWFAQHALQADGADLGGSSDHAGFTAAGIPTGGLFAGASASGSAAQPGASGGGLAPDPCYHIGCDGRDNVDVERVALFSEATTDVVLSLYQE
jgi:hypothetical protein